MISGFRDLYKNSTIAILGSGPSIGLYSEKEDIAISVNGASLLTGKKYNFFLAGDVRAPERKWWLASKGLENVVRVVSSYIAPFDPILYPDEDVRNSILKKYNSFVELDPYINFVPEHIPERPNAFFRFGGFGKEYVERISRKQDLLYWGGTISSIALQFSIILGGEDIHLYGCGLDNHTGKNYHYPVHDNERGGIENEQVEIMQATIDKIRGMKISISIHGESRIK